jgi:AraC-like DNA-binding protein
MRADLVCLSTFRSPWGVAFPQGPSHIHIVQSGVIWAWTEGGEAICAEAGDLVLFPRGGGHFIADNVRARRVALADIPQQAFDSETMSLSWGGSGAESRVLCCRFLFGGPLADQLLAALPPIIHINRRRAPSSDWLDIISRYLIAETMQVKPGTAVMISRLIDLLFVQTLRAWANGHDRALGWLGGLNDPRIGRALAVIHASPARKWTAVELAHEAGLSRSAFADRFAKIVGEPPLSYLTRWRLNLAADLLVQSGATIGDIARRVGYGSDAGFNKAFKAQFGATAAAFRGAAQLYRSAKNSGD